MKGTTLHGVLKCVDDNENRVDNEKNNAENDEWIYNDEDDEEATFE